MAISFGTLLREHRKKAGLTQEELAARALISSQAVGALERGTRRFPHQYTIDRLADALRLDGEQRTAFAAAAFRPPSVALTEDPPAAQPTAVPLPRQMPPPTSLTGRDAMVAEIAAKLSGATTADGHTALLVGPGGIGKTALALAVGHRLAKEYADGQLFADLRGAQEQPVDPHVVAGRFLRALGVPPAEVPSDADERLAAYRSLLSGRRMLLVLDDAAAEEQVRPLLPPSGGCATVVTSRRHLGALVGAARWTVPALGHEDALRLLARIAGAERIAHEPAAAAQVAHACGYSPLAICVAAGRLSVHPHWTVAELSRRLTAEQGRLDALSVGDLDVRASIGLSYRALGKEHRQLIRRLALFWAPDWPAWLADDLCAGPADPLLDELVNVHLVEPVGMDTLGQQRFRLHDLIAEYARERCQAEEDPEDVDRIAAELLRAWLAVACVADDAAGHGYQYGAGLTAGPAPARLAMTAQSASLDWFEVERITLVAAVGHAARLGHAELTAALALRLAGFLRVRGYRDDHISTLHEALAAVRLSGHDRLRLRLAQALFTAYLDNDLDAEMGNLTEEMLASARALGEPELLIRALMQAGLYAKRRGRLGEAADYAEQALAASGDSSPLLLATALSSVATIYIEAGRPHEALPLSERAVAVQRGDGAPVMLAMRLLTHADVLAELGRQADSETALAEALTLTQAAGHEAAQAYAEVRLGDLAARRGQWALAGTLIRRACATYERLGDSGSVAYALRWLGDVALAQGRPFEAIEPFHRALETCQRLRLPLEAARLHARLSVALSAVGDADAVEHRAECDRILAGLGLEEPALRLGAQRVAARAAR